MKESELEGGFSTARVCMRKKCQGWCSVGIQLRIIVDFLQSILRVFEIMKLYRSSQAALLCYGLPTIDILPFCSEDVVG